jgi:site-specific recombinase XerD
MSPADLFKTFERYLRAQDRAEKTVGDYLTDLRLFAEWFTQTRDEPFKPQAITPTDVREYRAYLLNVKRQSPATINRRLVTLRVFCRWAMNEGLLASDPTSAIKPVKQVQPAPRWLDRKEQYALRRAAEKDGDVRNLAILLLLLNTGLRVSEVAGLKLSDVELSERKGQITVRGKGTKVRTVPLNAEVRRALREYLAKRPKVKHDAVFVNQRGEPLGRLGIEYQVATLGRVAGLEHLTPHMLRHTFAKNLIDQSVSLDQVAMLMGHRSLTTTARYTQPSQQDLVRAVERLGGDE